MQFRPIIIVRLSLHNPGNWTLIRTDRREIEKRAQMEFMESLAGYRLTDHKCSIRDK